MILSKDLNITFIIKEYMFRKYLRSSHCGSVEMNLTGISEDTGSIPGLTQWIKDPALPQCLCRLQTWLGFGIAVGVAGSYSSDLTPRLGTFICHGCGPKKTKKKKKKERKYLTSCLVLKVFSAIRDYLLITLLYSDTRS